MPDLDESTDSPAIRRLAHDAIGTIPHGSTSATDCSWAPVPDPPPFNDDFELEFTVRDLDTDALVGDDAQVAATLRMPQHSHGLVTTPEMSRRDDGVFVLTGVLLHMQGEWVMRVRVVADEVIDEASFVLNLH